MEGLTKGQLEAYDLLLSGANCFITGDAGTGKSYLIQHFIKRMKAENKNIMVVAPTGIAALNVGGVTIHRAFKAPVGPILYPSTSVPDTIKNADIIIMDEVSMCRMDLFSYCAMLIAKVNKRRILDKDKPIQFITIGDFFQLPPVISDRDRDALKNIYPNLASASDKGFAFESDYWADFKFKYIILEEVVRQADKEMADHLTSIRCGDKDALPYFKRNSSITPIKDAIVLCATNKRANEVNSARLAELGGETYTYISEITGNVKDTDKPIQDILELKIGARVMMMVNDVKFDNYVNGSFGTIVDCFSEGVKVLIDDSDEEVYIGYNTWEIKDYIVSGKKVEEKVIGTFEQLPIRLAYAITIHKSQGQTYDKVNLEPYCFDDGQLYVAMSRCKDINKLYIKGALYPNYLMTNKVAMEFFMHILERRIKNEN